MRISTTSWHLTSSTLTAALLLAGEVDRAKATFERAVAYANDVGLLAEEVDPTDGEPIGNYPQASATSGWSAPPGRPTRRSRARWRWRTRPASSPDHLPRTGSELVHLVRRSQGAAASAAQ